MPNNFIPICFPEKITLVRMKSQIEIIPPLQGFYYYGFTLPGALPRAIKFFPFREFKIQLN
jgi:hypothetical protein